MPSRRWKWTAKSAIMTLCQLDVDVDGEVTHLDLRLLENAAPETCSNFRRICDGSAQQSFDGCLFETIIPGSLMRTQRPQGAQTSMSSGESRSKRAKRGDALLGPHSQLTIMLGSESEIDNDQTLLGEIVNLHALDEVERAHVDGVKVKLMKCGLPSETLATRDEKGRICKGRGFLSATRRVPDRYEDGWIGVAVKRREDRSVTRRRWQSRSAEGPAASRRQQSRRSPPVNSRRSPVPSLSKQREVRIERRRVRSLSPRPHDRSRTETRRRDYRYRGRNRSRSRSRSVDEPGLRNSPPPTKRPSRTIHVHSNRTKRADRKGWSGSGSKNEVVPLLDT